MFEPRTVKDRLNVPQRWIVLTMDVLLLAELIFSMKYASQTPVRMTEVFLRLYIPMLLCTVISARLLMRYLRSAQDKAEIVQTSPLGTAE